MPQKPNIYDTQILLGMLDRAIGGLIENEICSYCKIRYEKDYRCQSGEFCKSLILQGLYGYKSRRV